MANAENPDYEGWNPETDSQLPIPGANPHNQGVLPEANTRRAKKAKEPTEKHIREWLQFAANIILAVVGIIAICIYKGQLDIYKGQLGTMTNTLSEIQKQTPLIDAQADAARKSVIEVQRQTRIDERPWIKFKLRDEDKNSIPPKSQQLTLNLNQPFVVPVQFVNIGKTTALNVEGGVVIKLVQVGQEPSMPTAKEAVVMKGELMPKNVRPLRRRTIHGFEAGTIYPGEFSALDAHRLRRAENGKVADQLVTQEDIAGFVKGEKYFVVWGEIHYSDIFGTRHWTRFCSATPFVSEKCILFNDMDKNDGIQKPN